jgi:antibiotic biosynthesis monooxygenase (ABM) superfamily enzyme
VIDFSNVDTSPIYKMALILGVSFFGILFLALILGKLLQLLKVPNRIIQTLLSLISIFSFLYLVAYLGDSFL